MPTYTFKCECGNRFSVVERMKDHTNTRPCACGKTARQVVDVPIVVIPQHMRYDWNGYESPIDGRRIRNLKERADDMARNDCIEYDPGMRQDADRRNKEAEDALDKSIEEDLGRQIAALPQPKLEQLNNELARGASIEAVRQ